MVRGALSFGRRTPRVISWSDTKVNPHLASWAEKKDSFSGENCRALVVGCGYGYDAEWLAGRGFNVTAFDISKTAISSARKRFPGSPVNYQVADVRELPKAWEKAFDFVFEAYTLQVLQGEARKLATKGIASAVRKTLLMICRGRDEEEDRGMMPWPLTRQDLFEIVLARPDLVQTSFQDFMDKEEDPPVRRFRVEYTVQ